MTRTTATSAMSPPDSELSGMCSSKRSTAAGRRGAPRIGGGAVGRDGSPRHRTRRECKGDHSRADVHDVLLPASHRGISAHACCRRCDSGGVTTVHPVRAGFPARPRREPRRRSAGVLPGAELCWRRCSPGPRRRSGRSPRAPRAGAGEQHAAVAGLGEPALRDRLEERGVLAPWRHQVDAAQLARDGRHVVVATGTASGKSLAYQLPALTRLAEDPRACVLYLAPTKALARDQLASVAALADPVGAPGRLRRRHPGEERDWVRRHSRWIVTNPDMLHRGILPGAPEVVEHAAPGGLRRHRRVPRLPRGLRLARRARAAPAAADLPALRRRAGVRAGLGHGRRPAAAATRLVGAPVEAVTDDGSPRPVPRSPSGSRR